MMHFLPQQCCRSAISSGDSQWHSYKPKERHTAWKILLPVFDKAPILALGLQGPDLSSLARTWKTVYVSLSSDRDLDWAKKQGEALGLTYNFEKLRRPFTAVSPFSAIGIGGDGVGPLDPKWINELLLPGGAVVWTGTRNRIPHARQLMDAEFTDIGRYGILPRRTGRVLVPLTNSKRNNLALGLYTPRRWQKHIALIIARSLLPLKVIDLLMPNQVVIARKAGQIPKDVYLMDFLGKCVGQPVVDFGIYCGWHNLTVQMLSDQFSVVGIAKLSDVVFGDMGISMETNALRKFETVPEMQAYVPRILASGNWGGYTFHVQKNVSRNSGAPIGKLTDLHIKFLSLLSTVDRHEAPVSSWHRWDELWRWVHCGAFKFSKDRNLLCDTIESCHGGLAGKPIPFNRIHGDFAPWNIFISGDTIKVIDWQYSEIGLPLYDAIYFCLSIRPPRGALPEELLLNPLSYLGIKDMLRVFQGNPHLESIARIAVIDGLEWICKRRM